MKKSGNARRGVGENVTAYGNYDGLKFNSR